MKRLPLDRALHPLDHLATTEDVARLVRVSRRTVQRWYYHRIIPGLKIGHLLRFRLADVQKALSRYTQEELK
jgi:excisionase family DNA binding protein